MTKVTTRFRTNNITVSDDTIRGLVDNLEFVDSGLYRDVYNLGFDYVLKVARVVAPTDDDFDESACRCNIQEAKLYQLSDDRTRSHLGRVRSCSPCGSWMVMDRADIVLINSNDLRDNRRHIYFFKYSLGLEDVHLGNLGLYGKKVKIIDYAGWPKDCTRLTFDQRG